MAFGAAGDFDGAVFCFPFSDGALMAETAAGSATLSTQYVWLEGEPIAMIRNNSIYYITSDQTGRPETVMTPGFSVVWKASNTVYDRTVVTDTIGGLNLGFPGQYYDSESGLWNNWNRYYDASMGRYIQSDPVGLVDDLNTYLYAGANPIIFFDPYGLWKIGDPLPESFVNSWTGVADGLSLGLGPLARNALGIDGGVDPCSRAYKAGQYGSLAVGTERLGYAALAKGIPRLVRGLSGREAAETAVFARDALKMVFRAGSPISATDATSIIAAKGIQGTIESAARTNTLLNAVGANSVSGGL